MAAIKTIQKRNKYNVKLSLTFEELETDNIDDLQSLNLVVLPIHYSSKFYKQILKNGGFGYLVIDNKTEDVIGGCCGVIHVDYRNAIYISTLGVYASWRRRGIGSVLIDKLIKNHGNSNITHVVLHCSANDSNAIQFYKANGFIVVRQINNFYRKLQGAAANAFEMRKTIK
eukprot:117538_1